MRNTSRTKSYTIPLLVIVFLFLAADPLSASIRSQREIVINLPEFTLYLYEKGEVIRTYPIGIGRVVNPSLLGETQIINNVHDPTYYPPDWYRRGLQPIPPGPDNPVGTRWLGLGFRGYGIHGTNQPWTIGTAASAGCIRLYNEDVEELSRLVGIGTRVTFIYETVDAAMDPITNEPTVKIYPDVYNKEENRVDLVLQRLALLDVDTQRIDRDFVGGLLEEAAGEPRRMAYTVPLTLDGIRVTPSAVTYNGQIYVPLHGISERLGRSIQRARTGEAVVDSRVVKDSFFLGNQQAYAPIHDAMRSFGLLPKYDGSTIAFETVRFLADNGQVLRITPFVDDNKLLLPVSDVAALLGVQVAWDASHRTVVVNRHRVSDVRIIAGKAYLPHDTVSQLLGARIHWFPWQKTAQLELPTIRLRGFGQEGKGFVEGEKVFVPVDLVTDYLGMTLTWSELTKTAYIQGKPIPGVSRGGQPYAAIETLVSVIPSLQFRWDDDVYDLELMIQTGS